MPTVQLASVPLAAGQVPVGTSVLFEVVQSLTSRATGRLLTSMTMPPAGQSLMDAIASPPGTFFLRITMQSGHAQVAIGMGPIDNSDIIAIIGGPSPTADPHQGRLRSHYSGLVTHTNPQATQIQTCDVYCHASELIADECCVMCTQGDITVKFCC